MRRTPASHRHAAIVVAAVACSGIATAGQGREKSRAFCGQLVSSPFCGVALADQDGGLWLLEDVGEFALGDIVAVVGTVDLKCVTLPECAVSSCLQVASIEPGLCPLSVDLDGDGHVNGSDLAVLLAAWGACPPLTVGCTGDLDFSGVVDAADLSQLLAGWTG